MVSCGFYCRADFKVKIKESKTMCKYLGLVQDLKYIEPDGMVILEMVCAYGMIQRVRNENERLDIRGRIGDHLVQYIFKIG